MPDLPPPRCPRLAPSPHRHRHPLAITVAALAAALVALTACGSDDRPATGGGNVRPAAPTSTTTTAATRTTAPPTPEAEVKAAYLEIIEHEYAWLAHPTSTTSSLIPDRSGASLLALERRIKVLADEGVAYLPDRLGPPVPTFRTVTVSGTSATIVNCVVDTTVGHDASGHVVDDSVNSVLLRSELRFAGQRWKLDSQTVIGKWPDRKGCDR